MSAYTFYDGSSASDFVTKLLANNSRLSIDPSSIKITYGTCNNNGGSCASLGTYDGSLALGMGPGLLLTTGTAAPPETNTSGSYSVSFLTDNSDTQMNAIAKTAFSGAGSSHNVTSIEFSFTSTDLFFTGLSLDLMFGSDEYPEFSNTSFVDIAAVLLNGQNIALFNGQSDQPLSVIAKNLSVGNFRNNTDKSLPIEYDGLSGKLTINSGLKPGVNSLKIAIADTGDTIYDSGLFIGNLKATQFGGSGLSVVKQGSDSNDNLLGTANNETFDAGAGDDVIDPGEGDDIVYAGAGNDTILGGKGNNQIDGGDGFDKVMYNSTMKAAYIKPGANNTIKVGLNSDTLLNVEQIACTDGSFNANNIITEDKLAKLYIAYFGRAPDWQGLNYWLGVMNDGMAAGKSFNEKLKDVLYSFAISNEAQKIYPGLQVGTLDTAGIQSFVNKIYNNLFERSADPEGLAYWTGVAKSYQDQYIPLGTIIMDIIGGAQDTDNSLDRTLIQHKAQAAWFYANQFELNNKSWSVEQNAAQAANILDNVTADPSSVNTVYAQIIGIAAG